jgi:hypothetical protein
MRLSRLKMWVSRNTFRIAFKVTFVSRARAVPLAAVALWMLVSSFALAQPGSTNCKNAQAAVATQNSKIAAFEATRDDPRYAGSAMTLYTSGLAQLKATLAALEAGEQLECSAEAVAALTGQIIPKYMLLTVV